MSGIKKFSSFEKTNEDIFTVEPELGSFPREEDISKIFGKYKGHIPDDVLRYMRKNPKRIVKALVDVYGTEQIMEYIKK
jgi:hypothetical protein